MNWQEIYNKHKDTELMKAFLKYYIADEIWLRIRGIKDIFGWLLCFAINRGVFFDFDRFGLASFFDTNNDKEIETKYVKTPEQAMRWCAEKFFELKRK